MKSESLVLLAAAACSFFTFVHSTVAQGTAFTYQGRLNDGASPANGSYDVQFTIYDALTSGSAVAGPTVAYDVAVSNGLFTVALDFGSAPFNGDARWLDIAIRPGASGGSFTNLVPRQPITSTPYAIRAANYNGEVAASQLTGTIASSNIGAGTITGTMLAAGSVTSNNLAIGSVTSSSLADGAVSLEKLDATPVPLGFVTLNNPTPTGEEQFGRSVAAVGNDRVLVGAHRALSGGQSGAGEAYLFNTNGTLLTTITNPAPVFLGSFASAVASAGGNHMLIGAGLRPGFGATTNAYLFNTNGTLITTFTNPSGVSNDFFGTAVATVGMDKVLIGAPDNDAGAINSGAAYLFSTNGALLFTYTNPTPLADDLFGIAVAAVGNDHVLIGTFADTGAVYLFHTNGALVTTFNKPTPFASDSFGTSLAAFGNDRVLIGAETDDTGAVNTGAAHLFSTNGTLLTTFTNPAPANLDRFGVSVAAVGTDKVLIGAHGDDVGATNSGSAYLFDTNGTLLATFTNPTLAADDQFGFDVVALGINRIIVSAPQDDAGTANAGAAYVLNTEQGALMSGLFAGGVAAGTITPAMLSADVGTWSRSGSNLFYTAGNVGVGTSAPASRLHVSGTVTATALSGDGSGLTQLNASQLASGTVPDGRLSGTYSGAATFNNAANSFSGSGAGLTGLNAGSVAAGTLAVARGGTGTGSTLSGVVLGGNPLSAVAASAGAQLLRRNAGNSAFEFVAPSGGGDPVGTSRTISTGLTLTGGGDLSANRTLNLNLNNANVWSGAQQFLNTTLFAGSGVWDSSGNVGVGTTTPNAKLHVAGNISMTSGSYHHFDLSGGNALGYLYGSFPAYADGVHLGYNYYADASGIGHVFNPGGATSRLTVGYGFVGINIGGVNAAPNTQRLIADSSGVTVYGTFNNLSDRNAKQGFTAVNPSEILDRVARLPISEWSYKEDSATRHIGPMAQDFHSAFKVGTDERHIAPIDEGGVALAAIQGLNEKVEVKGRKSEDRIQKLELENAELKARLEKLEQRLAENQNSAQ